MDRSEREEVRRTVASLTAQLERITRAVEKSASEKIAPAGGPPRPSRAPPPPAAQGGPFLSVRSQGESVRAFLVIFAVTFGLGAIVFAWFWMGIEDAVRLAAVLMGIVASVVGFYFGQRGASRTQTQATFAMRGWQSAEARSRELEDWIWIGEGQGGRP